MNSVGKSGLFIYMMSGEDAKLGSFHLAVSISATNVEKETTKRCPHYLRLIYHVYVLLTLLLNTLTQKPRDLNSRDCLIFILLFFLAVTTLSKNCSIN